MIYDRSLSQRSECYTQLRKTSVMETKMINSHSRVGRPKVEVSGEIKTFWFGMESVRGMAGFHMKCLAV